MSFFFQKRVRVSFKKNRVRLGLVFVLGLGFRFEFGIGKLIGGAVGTVGCGSRKLPVSTTHRGSDVPRRLPS